MRKRMNRKVGIGVLILLITVCFVPAMAGAFAPGGGERGKRFEGKGHHRSHLGIWRDSQIVANLGLTDEQVDQLRDLDFKHREKRQSLKAQIDSLRLQMDKAFTDNNIDKTAVRQIAEKLANAKGNMYLERTEKRLALQEILTAEQMDKLEQYRMDKKGRGMQQGQRQGKGRHWTKGQD